MKLGVWSLQTTVTGTRYEQRPLVYYALAAKPGGNDEPSHYSATLWAPSSYFGVGLKGSIWCDTSTKKPFKKKTTQPILPMLSPYVLAVSLVL